MIFSTPPVHVHHLHLCRALLTARSIFSSSNVFLISFSRFRDQKTPFMIKIFVLKSFLDSFYKVCQLQNGHHYHHPDASGKFKMGQKRIRESFYPHRGPSQYMSGDYFYEFGKMSRRRFSRLGTSCGALLVSLLSYFF